ncbi:hypothetical protein LP419_35455 [Massilia sp. H-1]|nr:hypothetical protein LP419_35455 [Massilia sp. H-1]
MSAAAVFHEGERAVQARTGETVIADHNGTVLSAQVIPGALSSANSSWWPWPASVRTGGYGRPSCSASPAFCRLERRRHDPSRHARSGARPR